MGLMKDWGGPLLIAVLSGAGAFFGTQVNKQVEDRKLDIQMVQIALDLLRSDADDAKLQSARAFAIRALQKYSGLKEEMTPSEWDEWQRSGSVPEVSWGTTERLWPDSKPFYMPVPSGTGLIEPPGMAVDPKASNSGDEPTFVPAPSNSQDLDLQ